MDLNRIYSLMGTPIRNHKMLNEIKAIEAKNRYYSNIDDEDFETILRIDPTKKSGVSLDDLMMTPMRTWLLDMFLNGQLDLTDRNLLDRLKACAMDYYSNQEIKKNIEPKIKLKMVDAETFCDEVNAYKEADIDMSESERIEKNTEKIYEDDDWLVLSPLNREAGVYWGQNTTWCTAGSSSRHYFPSYCNGYKCLFIFINKNLIGKKSETSDTFIPESKYQISMNEEGNIIDFCNAMDRAMPKEEYEKYIPEKVVEYIVNNVNIGNIIEKEQKSQNIERFVTKIKDTKKAKVLLKRVKKGDFKDDITAFRPEYRQNPKAVLKLYEYKEGSGSYLVFGILNSELVDLGKDDYLIEKSYSTTVEPDCSDFNFCFYRIEGKIFDSYNGRRVNCPYNILKVLGKYYINSIGEIHDRFTDEKVDIDGLDTEKYELLYFFKDKIIRLDTDNGTIVDMEGNIVANFYLNEKQDRSERFNIYNVCENVIGIDNGNKEKYGKETILLNADTLKPMFGNDKVSKWVDLDKNKLNKIGVCLVNLLSRESNEDIDTCYLNMDNGKIITIDGKAVYRSGIPKKIVFGKYLIALKDGKAYVKTPHNKDFELYDVLKGKRITAVREISYDTIGELSAETGESFLFGANLEQFKLDNSIVTRCEEFYFNTEKHGYVENVIFEKENGTQTLCKKIENSRLEITLDNLYGSIINNFGKSFFYREDGSVFSNNSEGEIEIMEGYNSKNMVISYHSINDLNKSVAILNDGDICILNSNSIIKEGGVSFFVEERADIIRLGINSKEFGITEVDYSFASKSSINIFVSIDDVRRSLIYFFDSRNFIILKTTFYTCPDRLLKDDDVYSLFSTKHSYFIRVNGRNEYTVQEKIGSESIYEVTEYYYITRFYNYKSEPFGRILNKSTLAQVSINGETEFGDICVTNESGKKFIEYHNSEGGTEKRRIR